MLIELRIELGLQLYMHQGHLRAFFELLAIVDSRVGWTWPSHEVGC